MACEAATWLAGLGAEEVTLVEPAPALLARHEPFVGERVARRFEELGITVLTDTAVDRVERASPVDRGEGHLHGGPVIVHAGDHRVTADEIVVAAGRTPASSDLGLDTVGVDPGADHGFVTVDDHLTVAGVAGEWLYAVGDLCGRALLTHMGKYQGTDRRRRHRRPGRGTPPRGRRSPGPRRPRHGARPWSSAIPRWPRWA